MCLVKLEQYTEEERLQIAANDYVFCQGFYKDMQENIKEYWNLHKIACDRNELRIQCVTHECLRFL